MVALPPRCSGIADVNRKALDGADGKYKHNTQPVREHTTTQNIREKEEREQQGEGGVSGEEGGDRRERRTTGRTEGRRGAPREGDDGAPASSSLILRDVRHNCNINRSIRITKI